MLHAGMLRSPGGSTAAPPDWPDLLRALAASTTDARLKKYYAASIVPPDTPLARTPLLAMDVETTGLNPARDGIVSIGLVPMQLDRVFSSRSRHWILKPRAELDTESVVFHGITDAQVRQAPDIIQILDDLLAAMAGHVMVVHCRAIEQRFLDAALRERIGEGIRFPVIDTMELEARQHRRSVPGLVERLLRRTTRRISIRLADSRARYGLPRYQPHHAMTDALATAELLQAQVAHHHAPDMPVRALWH